LSDGIANLEKVSAKIRTKDAFKSLLVVANNFDVMANSLGSNFQTKKANEMKLQSILRNGLKGLAVGGKDSSIVEV
jgi:hypothetical protein